MSASMVLPCFADLIYHSVADREDPAYISRFKAKIREELSERRRTMSRNLLLKCSTALDPRYKNLKSISRDDRDQVWMHVKTLCKLKIQPDEPVLEPADEDHVSAPGYESESDGEGNDLPSATIQAEKIIMRYRGMERLDTGQCPLQWWKQYGPGLKPLDEIALKYLSCPATSVPSERLFSKAGNIISKKRSSLLPENANAMICLNSWVK